MGRAKLCICFVRVSPKGQSRQLRLFSSRDAVIIRAEMSRLKKLVPPWAKDLVHKVKYYLFYRGQARYCPVCDHYSSEFLPMVWKNNEVPGRENVKCPYCYSFERHRMMYLYLKRKTDLLSHPGRRQVLHIAPEPCLRVIFKKTVGRAYRTADLLDPTVDLKIDICNIALPDNSFDVILCSHVLEHVPDDQRAMREFSRILKPNGYALIMVPVTSEKTFEDWTITDPKVRNQVFGMDHVRCYGPDVEDRLRANNFEVSCTYSRDFMSQEEMALMGVYTGDQVYRCTKAVASPTATV